MKKIYSKWLEGNEQVSIRPKWIRVLRLLAEGKSRNDVASMFSVERNNLDTKLKMLRETVLPIMAEITDDIRHNHLIESPQKTAKKIQEAKKNLAKLGLLPGGVPPFGTIYKDGLLFPKPDGDYKTLLKIFEYRTQGKGVTWLKKKFKMTSSKIRHILRDIRYDKRFRWDGVEYKAAWDQLIPKKLWNRVQARHPPKGGAAVLKFGYEYLNGERKVKTEEAALCNRVVEKYLAGEASSKIMHDKKIKIDGSLFYSILRDESRTGWILKNGKLGPSGYPEIISREDFEKAHKILKSHERWNSLVRARIERRKKTEAKILSLIPCYRSEIIEKILEKSPITIKARIKGMKDKNVLQEREDGLLHFYGLPPKDVSMKLTKAQEAFEIIKGLMPAYRWQIHEKLKMSRSTVIQYVDRLKKNHVLKERSDGLLQKDGMPFPERVVETKIKRVSEKRRKILSVFLQREQMSKKELAEKTCISYRVLCERVQDLKNEGFLKEKDGKLRLSDRSVLSKLSMN